MAKWEEAPVLEAPAPAWKSAPVVADAPAVPAWKSAPTVTAPPASFLERIDPAHMVSNGVPGGPSAAAPGGPKVSPVMINVPEPLSPMMAMSRDQARGTVEDQEEAAARQKVKSLAEAIEGRQKAREYGEFADLDPVELEKRTQFALVRAMESKVTPAEVAQLKKAWKKVETEKLLSIPDVFDQEGRRRATWELRNIQERMRRIDKITKDVSQEQSTGDQLWSQFKSLYQERATPSSKWDEKGQSGVGEALGNVRPPLDFAKAIQSGVTLKAVKNLQDHGDADYPGRDADERLLEGLTLAALESQYSGQSTAGMITGGLGALPSWMAEFAATGGISAGVKQGAVRAGEKVLGGLAKKAVVKTGLKVAGATAGAMARGAALFPTFTADALRRQIPEIQDVDLSGRLILGEAEKPATAWFKAYGSAVIEALSEEAGEGITKGGGKILGKVPGAKSVIGKVARALRKVFPKGGKFDAVLAKGGYSTFPGELGEEGLAKVLHATFGTDPSMKGQDLLDRWQGAIPSGQEILVTSAVLAVPGAARAVASQTPGARAERRREVGQQALSGERGAWREAPVVGTGAADAVQRGSRAIAGQAVRGMRGEGREALGGGPVIPTSLAEKIKAVIAEDEAARAAETAEPATMPEKAPGVPQDATAAAPVQPSAEAVAAPQAATEQAERAGGEAAETKGSAVPASVDTKSAPTPPAQPPAAPAPSARAKEGKEPWEMTRREYLNQVADEALAKIRPDNEDARRYWDTEVRDPDNWANAQSLGHQADVQQARDEGKPVPPAVLAEYGLEGKRVVSEEAYKAARDRLKGISANPLFNLVDLATVGGYHLENLIRSGIKIGGKWNKRWRDAMIEDFGPKVKIRLPKVWQALVRDKARWQALKDLERNLGKPLTGGEVKRTLRRTTGQDKPTVTMTARKLLGNTVKALNRGTAEGIKIAETEGAEARRLLTDLVNRDMPEDQRAAMLTKVADAKTLNALAKVADTIDERVKRAATKDAIDRTLGRADLTQKELAGLAKKYLPVAERGRVLTAIVNADTPEKMQNARRLIQRVADAADWRDARRELFATLPNQRQLRTMTPDQRDVIRRIVRAVDLMEMSDDMRAWAEQAQRWLAEDQTGRPMTAADRLASRLTKTPLSQMNSTEVWRLAMTARNARKGSREAQKQQQEDWGREAADNAKNLMSEVEARKTRVIEAKEGRIPRRGTVRTIFIGEGATGAMNQAADQGPTSVRVLYHDIKGGDSIRLAISFEARDSLWAAMDKAKVSKREVFKWGEDKARKPFTLVSGQVVQLNPRERIDIALKSLDPGQMEKALDNGWKREGNPDAPVEMWTWDDVVKVRESLTEKEQAVADALRDWYRGLGSQHMNAWSMDEFGYEIATNDKYIPSRADPQSPQAGVIEDLAYLRKAVLEHMGITKERIAHRRPMLRGDAIAEFQRHVDQVSRLRGLARPIRAARILLGSPEVEQTLRQRYGQQRVEYWNRRLDAIEQLTKPPRGEADRLIQKAASGVARGILGLRITSKLKQYGGLAIAASELGDSDLAYGAAHMYDLSVDARMMKHSVQTRMRYDGSGVHLVTQVFGETPDMLGRATAREWLREAAMEAPMVGLQRGDRQVLRAIWAASEREVRRLRPDLRGESYFSEVARRHDDIVSRTQNTSSVIDMNGNELEAKNSPLKRLLIMFQNQNNKMFNVIKGAAVDFSRHKSRRNAGKLLRATTGVAANMAWSVVVTAFFAGLYKGTFKLIPDKDDFVRRMVDEAFSVFYGGDYASRMVQAGAEGKYRVDFRGNPLGETAQGTTEGVLEALSGVGAEGEMASGPDKGRPRRQVHVERGTEKAVTKGGTLLGIPIEAPWRLIKGLWKMQDAEEKDEVPNEQRYLSRGRGSRSRSRR